MEPLCSENRSILSIGIRGARGTRAAGAIAPIDIINIVKCFEIVCFPLDVSNLDTIETVECQKTATMLNHSWGRQEREDQLKVFVQINTSLEESKFYCNFSHIFHTSID